MCIRDSYRTKSVVLRLFHSIILGKLVLSFHTISLLNSFFRLKTTPVKQTKEKHDAVCTVLGIIINYFFLLLTKKLINNFGMPFLIRIMIFVG